jgi:hypothetical protein
LTDRPVVSAAIHGRRVRAVGDYFAAQDQVPLPQTQA